MTSITTSTDREWCVSYLDHDSDMTKDRFYIELCFSSHRVYQSICVLSIHSTVYTCRYSCQAPVSQSAN